ncbi:MAG: aminotransferase class I/II-fold pyridoxal phosphate-dependent enzyme [Actinomycetota bacterium]
MHHHTPEIDELADKIFRFAKERIELDPIPLGEARTEAELQEACGETITPAGIGGDEALRLFIDVLHEASLSVDYTRYLSFVPAAPTETSVLFDLVVGACSIYGGSWIEGAGAVFAENQALTWLTDIAGMPASTGGVFVPGGTVGNLSAMVAARGQALERNGGERPDRWVFLASSQSHSSVKANAAVMDAEIALVPVGDDLRMHGDAVAAALDEHGSAVAGVVATSGTTNLGLIDDLRSVGEVCRARNVWLHVDGAYGGAALAAPSARPLFDGLELADSFIVDPHKWLFAPFDCCALLYRDPDAARDVHAQHAGYLAFLDEWGDWNPSDFAIHLTRRVRGLPFWFSLATHGTDAYAAAVQTTLDIAADAAARIEAAPHLELVHEPSLSVVAFRRVGWGADDYTAWSVATMEDGTAFVVPSRHRGEPIFRFCFVNPRTTADDVATIIAAMA